MMPRPPSTELVAVEISGRKASASGRPASSRKPRKASRQPDLSHLPSILDVLENTTDHVAILDHDWRFTFLNRHAAAILGAGKNLIGEPLHNYFMPEKGSDAWLKTVDAAKTRRSAHFEFYASNHGRWFETHVHPIPSGLQIFFRDVTARRASDDALTQGEERLRLALEAAGDGAWDWDIGSGQASMSLKILQRLGYFQDQYDGAVAALSPIIHRSDLARVRSALIDHLAGRTDFYECEYRLRSQEQSWRWVSVRGRVIARDEMTGRATRMVGISSDISDRKAAEEKAIEQANLLSLAQSGAGAGAWSYDFSSRDVTLEPKSIELLGLPAGHGGVVGLQEWADIIHSADHFAVRSKYKEVMETTGNFAVEYRVRLADGGIRWIQCIGSQVENPTRTSRRLIGLILDVTSQKEAADALRESEERLRLALEATGDGAWEFNLVTHATIPSRRLLAKLGYDADTFTPTLGAYTALIHPDDVQASVAAFQDHLRGRTDAYSTEYRIRAASGEWLWFLDRGRVVGRDSSTGHAVRIVGTHSEITEKKRAELELRQMQAELVHLSRLSAMGAMASTLAHEINQPLTAIANFVRGIRHVAGPDMQANALLAEALDGVEGSAQRAGEIVRRLRSYVTKGEVEQRPESVADIVREACILALVDANALGINYTIDIDDHMPKALVDRVQIQQVLVNLVRNAVDAMNNCDRRELRVSARQVGRTIEFRVQDSGAGIAAAMRDQIFTPFASTKAEGMGVGLSICRTIVEAHKGQIWADDEPGGGTCFRFTVPACQSSRDASTKQVHGGAPG